MTTTSSNSEKRTPSNGSSFGLRSPGNTQCASLMPHPTSRVRHSRTLTNDWSLTALKNACTGRSASESLSRQGIRPSTVSGCQEPWSVRRLSESRFCGGTRARLAPSRLTYVHQLRHPFADTLVAIADREQHLALSGCAADSFEGDRLPWMSSLAVLCDCCRTWSFATQNPRKRGPILSPTQERSFSARLNAIKSAKSRCKGVKRLLNNAVTKPIGRC
jgi:hypothetical protein